MLAAAIQELIYMLLAGLLELIFWFAMWVRYFNYVQAFPLLYIYIQTHATFYLGTFHEKFASFYREQLMRAHTQCVTLFWGFLISEQKLLYVFRNENVNAKYDERFRF